MSWSKTTRKSWSPHPRKRYTLYAILFFHRDLFPCYSGSWMKESRSRPETRGEHAQILWIKSPFCSVRRSLWDGDGRSKWGNYCRGYHHEQASKWNETEAETSQPEIQSFVNYTGYTLLTLLTRLTILLSFSLHSLKPYFCFSFPSIITCCKTDTMVIYLYAQSLDGGDPTLLWFTWNDIVQTIS